MGLRSRSFLTVLMCGTFFASLVFAYDATTLGTESPVPFQQWLTPQTLVSFVLVAFHVGTIWSDIRAIKKKLAEHDRRFSHLDEEYMPREVLEARMSQFMSKRSPQ